MKKILFLIAFIIITSGIKSQHFVVLKNGKTLECVVTELKNDTLEIYIDMISQKIPLKQVESIHFKQHIEYDGKLTEKSETKTVKSGDYIIKYEVKDRVITKVPPVSNATEKKGRVVVKVIIDKYGHVMEAETGYIGSNTSDKYLLTKALKFSKEIMFNPHPKGPLKTEAIIIIEY